MPNEETTDLEFPKAKADLEDLIVELTGAVHSVLAELAVLKKGGGGGGWAEKVRWALAIIVIPLAVWLVSLHTRVTIIENSSEPTHVGEQLTDHETRIRTLEREGQ